MSYIHINIIQKIKGMNQYLFKSIWLIIYFAFTSIKSELTKKWHFMHNKIFRNNHLCSKYFNFLFAKVFSIPFQVNKHTILSKQMSHLFSTYTRCYEYRSPQWKFKCRSDPSTSVVWQRTQYWSAFLLMV